MNLATIIEGHPADDVALVAGDDLVTYGELRSRVARARAALVARGVAPGDRVAFAASNTPPTVVVLLAAFGVGAVPVPLNPQSPAAERERELGGLEPIVVVDVAEVDVGDAGDVDVTSAPAVVERDVEDPAVLMFTSGTAGASQAACLTHGNLLANIEQADGVDEMRRRSDDVTLGVLPLFHVFGLNVVLLPTLRAGGRVVLVDSFEPVAAAELVARHSVTLLTGPPTLWAALAATEGLSPEAFGSIRLAASGAAALSVAVGLAVAERLGVVVHEGYGLTEASPIVATTVGTDAPPGSIGRPLPGIDVRLVDANGDDVLVGDVGHLHARGPNVFAGYHGDDDATAAVLDGEGWLRTGDLATVDDDGFLFIVDRVKDLVIVSGFNVFPAEVEAVLAGYPSVADVAVRGAPSDRTGEMVVADVVAAPEAPGDDDTWFAALDAHVGAHLSRYKCPAEYHRVAAIPRGLGGKVQRRLLPRVEEGPAAGT